jgi:hypothetical protein
MVVITTYTPSNNILVFGKLTNLKTDQAQNHKYGELPQFRMMFFIRLRLEECCGVTDLLL